MSGIHVRFEITPERFLEDLTDAAQRAALSVKKGSSPKRLRASLKRALKAVLKRDMQESEQCGAHIIGICTNARRTGLWPSPGSKT